jgi:uncharacterized membrane protein YdjX (TVP38/TMEM64 family)
MKLRITPPGGDRQPNGEAPVLPIHARALVLGLLVVGLVALASSGTVHEEMLEAFEAAKVIMARHPLLGPALFVVLAGLSAMLAFFSTAVLVPAAVYAWGPVVTAVLLWLGWMLGGLGAYTLAAVVGRPAMRWLSHGHPFAAYQKRLRRETPFGLVLLFQLALPSEIPGYVLGLARYPLHRYLAALAIAEVPYAVGTMLLGESFVTRRVWLLVALGAAAVVAAVLLGRALRRRLG